MAKFQWDDIQKLARAHHLEDPLASTEHLTRFLQFWWCRHYIRPLKDPILHTYTLEELTYEWLRHLYMRPENDPKKDLEATANKDEEDEWIKAQLTKIQNQMATKPAEADVTPPEALKPPEPEEKLDLSDLPPLPDIDTKF